MMRAIVVTYSRRDGQRGRLHCIAPSTWDALLQLMESLGDELRSASARALPSAQQAAA